MQETNSRLRTLEDTLTQEEKDAATYLEWSDATIATGVRAVAKTIGDRQGNFSMMCVAAAGVLRGIARDFKKKSLEIEFDDGTKLTINTGI